MKHKFVKSVGMALFCAWLAACATERVLLEAVGPVSPGDHAGIGLGRLVVFTAQQQSSSGDVTYQHFTSYRVLDDQGKLVMFVRNESGGRDGNPDSVTLPSGSYLVQAMAEQLGAVTVPVVVQALKTTEVYLRPGWKPDASAQTKSAVIRLPNGQPVGWRAPSRGTDALDEAKAARADAVVKVKVIQLPDTMGTAAYAVVETVAVLRNNSSHAVVARFTLGYRNIQKGPPAGVSVVYLQLVKKENGVLEWFLLED